MAAHGSTAALEKDTNDHLNEIRRRKGVDCSDGKYGDNVRDLDSALDM